MQLIVNFGNQTTSATHASTTTKPASPAPYARVGPYAIGFTGRKLAGGRRVVVWYAVKPGDTAGHAQETIDIGGMLSPALQRLIPAKDRVKYKDNAYADAPAARIAGGYPVVIFSHGFAGYPEQSVDIATHLASWGFVVAAPDHVERSLDGLLGTAGTGVPKMTDVQVLQAALDLVLQDSKASGLLHGLANAEEAPAW